MDKNLMAISTSMLVLKLLDNQDMYGYQIIKELESRSEKIFALKEGTLYPVLHGLEEQGAIESYPKFSESGRRRKYYHITAMGKAVLSDKTKEWNCYQTAVNRLMGGVILA